MLESYVRKLLSEGLGLTRESFDDLDTTFLAHVNSISSDHAAAKPTSRRQSNSRSSGNFGLGQAADTKDYGKAENAPVYAFKGFKSTDAKTTLLSNIGPGETSGGPGEELLGEYLSSTVVTGNQRNSANSTLFGSTWTNVNGDEFIKFNGQKIGTISGESQFPAYDIIIHSTNVWNDAVIYDEDTKTISLNMVLVSSKFKASTKLVSVSRTGTQGDRRKLALTKHETSGQAAQEGIYALVLSAISKSPSLITLKAAIIANATNDLSSAISSVTSIGALLHNSGIENITVAGHDYYNMCSYPYMFGDESSDELKKLHIYLAFVRPFIQQTYNDEITIITEESVLVAGTEPIKAHNASVAIIDSLVTLGTVSDGIRDGARPEVLLRSPEILGTGSTEVLASISGAYARISQIITHSQNYSMTKADSVINAAFNVWYESRSDRWDRGGRKQEALRTFKKNIQVPPVSRALEQYAKLLTEVQTLSRQLSSQTVKTANEIKELQSHILKMRVDGNQGQYEAFVSELIAFRDPVGDFIPALLTFISSLNDEIKNFCRPNRQHVPTICSNISGYNIEAFRQNVLIPGYVELYADLALFEDVTGSSSVIKLGSSINEVNNFSLGIINKVTASMSEVRSQLAALVEKYILALKAHKNLYETTYEELSLEPEEELPQISNDPSDILDMFKDKPDINVPDQQPAPANQPFPEEELMVAESRLYESILLDLMETSSKKQRAANQPKKLKLTKRRLNRLLRETIEKANDSAADKIGRMLSGPEDEMNMGITIASTFVQSDPDSEQTQQIKKVVSRHYDSLVKQYRYHNNELETKYSPAIKAELRKDTNAFGYEGHAGSSSATTAYMALEDFDEKAAVHEEELEKLGTLIQLVVNDVFYE